MIQDKALRSSWTRKMKERQEKKLVRDLARQLQEGKRREREERKRRRAENLKRRLENERKAEIVQVVSRCLAEPVASHPELRFASLSSPGLLLGRIPGSSVGGSR
ncbi:CCD86 protein, partial [Centropus unirufus]|nr:CCD86 protein [Centropus unirufus]